MDLEKHAVTLMAAAILALMAWTTHTVHTDSKIIARLATKIENLERTVYSRPQSKIQNKEAWHASKQG